VTPLHLLSGLMLTAWVNAAVPPAAPLIQPGEVLSLERCISVALAQDPDLRGLGYAADAAQARLVEDRSVLLPSASASAGYQKNEAVKTNFDDPFRNASINTYDYKVGQVSVNQLLFDFGKRYASVQATRFLRDAARLRRDAQAVLISAEVKQAYYNLLQTKRARSLRAETVEQYHQHLAAAQTRFDAGARPKYYVTKAETDLSSAELDLIKADKDYQVAQAVLATAMNFIDPPPFDIVDTLDFEKYDATLDGILARATSDRQDLKGLAAQVDSSRKSLTAARGDLFPVFYASAAYQFGGSRSPYTNGWNAGVNVTADLFTGLRKIGKIAEARDLMRQTETQVESLKLQISIDARQAFLSLQEAEKAIQTATLSIKQAKENLAIAEISYTTGSGTPLDVTDATVLYSNARLNLISALYDYKIARANIEKTMGMR